MVLAVLGVFLPLLPTTPFLLLASACYLRSSEKSYRWLMTNRYLGPYIRGIKEERGMPLRAKIITIAILWVSIGYSIYRVGGMMVAGLLVLIAMGTTTLILRMKTLRR